MRNNESGIIIIITLWIMAILTIFALGIGYRTSLDLRLARYQLDKIKTLYITKAAVEEVKQYLSIDSAPDSDTKDYDSLYECGVNLLSEETPESLFKDISVGGGHYSIKYQTGVDENGQSVYGYGLSDEERKININTIDVNVLKSLFQVLGIEPLKCESIAASIIDWRDTDSDLSNPPYGAENDYYQNLENPYNCKNYAFETLEELLLVKDVTQEIFNQIKDYLTVYGDGKININTASAVVLQAVALNNPNLGINPSDFVNNIIDTRSGDDNIEGNANDVPYLTIPNTIPNLVATYLTTKSTNFRAKIQAVSSDNKVIKNTTVILDTGGTIKLYQEE